MSITDRRDQMDVQELAEELELRFPGEVSRMETRYPEAWYAVMDGYPESAPEEEMEDLLDDLRSLLRV